MKSTLIVGAGLAGLIAAQTLQEAGTQVIILEKEAEVGGRMATQQLIDNKGQTVGRIDHGAQYFTARSPQFQTLVDEWLADGVIAEWADGFGTPAGPQPDGLIRYRGHDGMSNLAEYLAHDLNILTEVKVDAAWHTGGGYEITSSSGRRFAADTLLLTPPAKQTLTLLDTGDIQFGTEARNALEAIQFAPCFSLLVTLDGPSAIPPPGGLWPNDGVIYWLADNQQKGISETPTMTIHASPQFSERYYDADQEIVATKLLAAANTWVGANILTYQIYRWRYSIPIVTHPEPYLVLRDDPLALAAGDAFAGPRVEGAVLSGLAAAEALLASQGTK